MKFVPLPSEAVEATTGRRSRAKAAAKSINARLRIWPVHYSFELQEARLSLKWTGIVHHLWAEATCFVSPFLAAGRTVATFHLPPAALQEVESRFWRFTVGRLSAAIALSGEQGIFLRETLGIPVEIIPHGIDVSAVQERIRQLPPEGPHRNCLFVGNYLRDFDALESVIYELEPGTTVSIVSSAPEAARLRHRLQLSRPKATVLFHAGVSDDYYVALLASADVFLLALQDGTANNALLEAMAAGLAVVSIGAYHPKEYLPAMASTSNRDGEQAAGEVERILDNRIVLEEMRASARAKAESLHWSKIVPRILRLYDSIGLRP